MRYRYARWDGTQEPDAPTSDDLAEHLAGELLDDHDLRSILRRLVQRGAEFPSGRRLSGLQDLLERLRASRQQRLSRFNLDSILDDLRARLDRVVETERQGIQRRLEQASREAARPDPGSQADASDSASGQQGSRLREMLERLARKHLDQLDQLPPDLGGRLQRLRDYEFMDLDARRQFQELLDLLQRQVAQSYFQGLQQAVQSMTPEALQQLQQMAHDLNRLLQQRLRGEPTEFEFREFMQRWGQFFPREIKDVDQLAQHLQRQIAQMESLVRSLSAEQRHELEAMLDVVFPDGQFQWELARLAINLERLMPHRPPPGTFSFGGDEPLSLQEGLRLMGEMNGLDQLERELLQAVRANDASRLDADAVHRLLGAEARRALEQLQQLTRTLEEAGLIRRGERDWELTPLALRRIGQRALRELFARLRLSAFGNHPLERSGAGVERLDETKPYAFGDPFLVDVRGTLFNGMIRQAAEQRGSDGETERRRAGERLRGANRPPSLPASSDHSLSPSPPAVRLTPDDFEVYRTTQLTQCASVILLDMSYSMLMGGRFQAGRKVALALDTLIRSQFPRDRLYVAAFSYFVLPLKPEMLFDSYWIEYGRGTNFQEALRQARLMLSRHKGGTRQILMVTDGEPTTYTYWTGQDERGGGHRYSYGPLEETLREVVRCTRDDIKLNIFMLDQSPTLSRFVQRMARLNRGRVFFSSPDRLGEYVLLDYVASKRAVLR